MNMENFTLKKPHKSYIWKVRSENNPTQILVSSSYAPKNFFFEIGQFVRTHIREMELIGYRLVKDHYGDDVEEIYQKTGKYMKQSILDAYNNSDIVKGY